MVDIGRRPRLVASFHGLGAAERFNAWRTENAELLASVPPEAFRVEYGRAADCFYVRVRIDERAVPPGLDGPDELGAGAGLPPRSPAA